MQEGPAIFVLSSVMPRATLTGKSRWQDSALQIVSDDYLRPFAATSIRTKPEGAILLSGKVNRWTADVEAIIESSGPRQSR